MYQAKSKPQLVPQSQLPIVYESPLHQRTRHLILALQSNLALTNHKINELESQIAAFDAAYRARFYDYIDAISALKATLGLIESDTTAHTAMVLTAPEQARLKAMYRQAAKYCHPDYLPSHLIRRGEAIFHQLTAAYRARDVLAVETWLFELESGQAFAESYHWQTNPRLLAQKKDLLQQRLTQQCEVLDHLQKNTSPQIFDTSQWNALLYDYQVMLEEELANLKSGY
ncbi:hypothetical protein [Ostreibacterium oceani]|uniref:J domain-containing protein n=1 Tax=Ostreibacterium oceani TaxID=2654998 RepID=A0A6N7EZE8_9GAMM|nr:hypothetical protein [Ostreibacterium oceani]MPV86930.1 hypothetical protein [Ostreibacterium oceani]